jgi:hypothetical protein
MRMCYGAVAVTLLALAAGCGGESGAAGEADAAREPAGADAAPMSAQDEFWSNLQDLCGNSYEGRLTEVSATDTVFTGRTLIMHVRQCAPGEVRIPFHVGDDRSRTWILTRQPDGLRLKHDHRHADGSEDEITQYGGDTRTEGSATVQEFYADEFTAELVPAAVTNVWTVEVEPGSIFAYGLRREGTDRRLRVEFDLMRQVQTPPAPWGY